MRGQIKHTVSFLVRTFGTDPVDIFRSGLKYGILFGRKTIIFGNVVIFAYTLLDFWYFHGFGVVSSQDPYCDIQVDLVFNHDPDPSTLGIRGTTCVSRESQTASTYVELTLLLALTTVTVLLCFRKTAPFMTTFITPISAAVYLMVDTAQNLASTYTNQPWLLVQCTCCSCCCCSP